MLRSTTFRAVLGRNIPKSVKLNSTNIVSKWYSVSSAASQTCPETNHYQNIDYQNAKPHSSIPGPTPWPIIGNGWRFLGGVDFLKICKDMQTQYGDIVLMRKLMAFGDMTFLFDIRDIEYTLRNEGPWPDRENLESNMYYRHTLRKDIFGDTHGLMNGKNEKWGTFRTAVNPIMMQPRTTHQYIPQINEIADEFIDLVKSLKEKSSTNETPKDFINDLNKWAFESVTAIAMDTRLGVLAEHPSEKAMKAIKCMMEIIRLSFTIDIMPTGKMHKKFNTATWKRFISCMDYFTDMTLELIEDAHKRIKNDPNYAKKAEHDKSVFEKLVANDKQVALVMTLDMLSAGIDTTAKVTGAILYHLAKYTKTQDKLREELKRLLPKKDTPLTKEILDEAKYLRACIKESLRLAPITFGNLRIMTKDLVIRGYQIPKGTIITMPNLYLCKVVDSHYSNPGEYIPERWLRSEKTENVNAFVSLPFGFGARSCIGKRMANMEIEVVISKMVRNFMMEWKHKDMTFKQEMLYGIADPLMITLSDVSN